MGVLRGVHAVGDSDPLHDYLEDEDDLIIKLFFRDRWFGSVKSATNIRYAVHHECLMVKTPHSRNPKKVLDDIMKGFSDGTWITI